MTSSKVGKVMRPEQVNDHNPWRADNDGVVVMVVQVGFVMKT